MKWHSLFTLFLPGIFFFNCNTRKKEKEDSVAVKTGKKHLPPKKEKKIIERKKPSAPIAYKMVSGKKWIDKHTGDSSLLYLVASINRTDPDHLLNRNILLPNDNSADIAYYLPFPLNVSAIKDIDKIIFFSYPTQAFGAYENGMLVYTGATNMGRKDNPTPTGLFFTNWKARETTSTFNDEWNLRWNFNVENKLGIGWHQYEMPGYPASHSCMRLQEQDARYLYSWADQWVMNKDTVTLKGTPVVIFGKYNFDATKPWLQLIKHPHALDISEEKIEKELAPYRETILAEQEKKLAVNTALD